MKPKPPASEYEARLNARPPHVRQQLLDGDWCVERARYAANLRNAKPVRRLSADEIAKLEHTNNLIRYHARMGMRAEKKPTNR